ncbi:MAG: DUF1289 domain-containing protein [Alphaproteobacteria bacterium]|nr:DUF1289 domain-containing protein [Alphaproteobacteria bacterium]
MATSPCIGVCRLDPQGRTCVGCGRTIAEIAAWPSLDEDERRRIVARLRQQSDAPPKAAAP